MENKLVVHLKDGRIFKGVTQDFRPSQESFHLLPAQGGGVPVKIRLEEMKALFYVKDYMGNRPVRDVTPNDVAGLISTLQQKGLKAWSIKKILTPLVGALKVSVWEGWLPSNPAERLLPHERPKADQKEMRVLDSNEIEALLREASTERCPLRRAPGARTRVMRLRRASSSRRRSGPG